MPPIGQVINGVLTNSGKDYLISPGDVIQIRVEDAPELSHHYQVTAAGKIEMPVLGQILVRDQTTYDLARLIANGLREQEYLKAPNVVVTVSQLNSRAFFIQGAVLKPGLYQLESRPSLLTLISLAGGLSENHGSTIFILRPDKTPPPASDNRESNTRPEPQTPTLTNDSAPGTATDYELIKVNIGALYKGHLDQNQRLEPGDIVNIPRAGIFFVAGEVKTPGSFPLKDGTTLRQAISLAQGMTYKAKPNQGIIFREDPVSGVRQEIKIDISAVMKGKGDDILIRANDVIIVPDSQAKAIGGAILTSFGLNAFRFPMR
jgi:polysaccharide export outer membrane protein